MMPRRTGRRAAAWMLLALGLAVSSQPEAENEPRSPGVPLIEHPSLAPAAGWPVWLKDHRTKERGEKTSAIAFAGRDEGGRRCFILADEIGLLRFCSVAQDGDGGAVELRLRTVGIDQSLLEDLAANAQWDFEGLALSGGASLGDSLEGLLSVEGRGKDAVEETRVLSIRLDREPGASSEAWRVVSLGDAIPGARFWRGQVGADRGIKGVAISPTRYWLGLGSFEAQGEINLRGAAIYLYDRGSGQVGTLGTRGLGIHSVCGLEALSDTVTIVADRNRQSLFVQCWDGQEPGTLRAQHRFPLELPAPGGYRYAIPTVEGVTVDDAGDLWCVIDPWHGHYRLIGAAPESVHVYLAAQIPMLYRFAGGPVWREAGLAHLWPTISAE